MMSKTTFFCEVYASHPDEEYAVIRESGRQYFQKSKLLCGEKK